MLKKDNDGKLYDIALAILGESVENSLMIDDSETKIEPYKQKGGCGFVYRDIAGLKSFLRIRK